MWSVNNKLKWNWIRFLHNILYKLKWHKYNSIYNKNEIEFDCEKPLLLTNISFKVFFFWGSIFFIIVLAIPTWSLNSDLIDPCRNTSVILEREVDAIKTKAVYSGNKILCGALHSRNTEKMHHSWMQYSLAVFILEYLWQHLEKVKKLVLWKILFTYSSLTSCL